jgi:hypothetical protein
MDLHNSYKYTLAIEPVAAATSNTAIVSNVIDTANFTGHEFVLITGTNADADATYTVLVEEGDTGTAGSTTLSDNTAVADADLIGTEASASYTFANDATTKKIGYRGSKRYIRVTVTPANNTGNTFLAAVWVQAGARVQPV